MNRFLFSSVRAVLIAALFFMLAMASIGASCSFEDNRVGASDETTFYRESSDVLSDEPAFEQTGGIVVLHGSGTVVEIDPETMTACIVMDDSSGALSGIETRFDFSSHTESQSVDIDAIGIGDRVEVTYFNEEDGAGFWNGESLVLAR